MVCFFTNHNQFFWLGWDSYKDIFSALYYRNWGFFDKQDNEIIKIYSTEKKIITDDIKTLFNNLNVKRVMFMNDSANNRVFIQITHQYTIPLPTGQNKTNTQYIVLSYNYKVYFST